MWYALTYTTFEADVTATVMTPPEDGWNEVSADDIANGKITNVQINRSKLTYLHTFIWAWYKDALGNISVYNVTYPTSTGQNWWVSDTQGPTGTMTWTVNNNDSSTYHISEETIGDDGIPLVTIQLVKDVSKNVKLKPELTDAISGLDNIKLDNSYDVNNNIDNPYTINTTAVHTIVATDKWGNKTTWKVSFVIRDKKEDIQRSAISAFFKNITNVFRRSSNESSYEPVKTNSVSLISTVQDFFTGNDEIPSSAAKSDSVEKQLKKTKKAAKKASKKASKKTSVKVDEVIPAANIIEETAPVVAEVSDQIESLVSDLTSLGDAAVEQTEVEVLPEVQPESTAAQAVTPEAAAPVQSEPVEIEVDEETSKLIYVIFAVLLVAAGTAVFFITKKLLNRRK